MNKENPNPVPQYIKDLRKKLPKNWEDPKVRTINMIMEQSGLLPLMTDKNPQLQDRLTDFFRGEKDILVVGGESGMGKSLIVAELVRLNTDLSHVLPPSKRRPLAVLGWDRLHQQFFEQVSIEVDKTIPLPKGETHISGRRIISEELKRMVHFLKNHRTDNPLILIETPLIDTRGEGILDEMPEYKKVTQVLIMHSPKCREETLAEGREKITANQLEGMNEMRENRLITKVGPGYMHIPIDERDNMLKHIWMDDLKMWDGMVVDWDPDDDRTRYGNSKALYRTLDIHSDQVQPSRIGKVIRRDYQSIFEGITNIDPFLKDIVG